MFEITGASDLPVTVNAGFWQWFKAGAAFTLGAIVMMSVASVVYFMFWLSFAATLVRALR